MKRLFYGTAVAAIVLLGELAHSAAAVPRPSLAARGEVIYHKGVDADGARIMCVTGDEATEVPAAVLSCVSCHGEDGRGRAEGGVAPSNIRWSELTKPYQLTLESGRKRPPYSPSLFIRSVTEGLDSAGHRLNPLMPRFHLSDRQAADLLEYLQGLDAQQDPGVTDDALITGVVLPPEGKYEGMSRAVQETLTAVFDAINQEGGIYGRKLSCRFVRAPIDGAAGALQDFLARERPFALLASYTAGAERDFEAVAVEQRIPVLGPITLSTGLHPGQCRYVFHLSSGVEGQVSALIRFSATLQDVSRTRAILVTGDKPPEGFIHDVARAAGGESFADWRVVSTSEASDWASLLRDPQLTSVFWLGSARHLEGFFAAAERLQTYPLLLAPSALAGPTMERAPHGFANRIYLASATLPQDQSTLGRAEFRAFAARDHWPEEDLATRLLTMTAAKAFAEAVRRTGRELTREKFVDALEQFQEVNFEQMRPLNYGPNRRVGTAGAYVAGVDLEHIGRAAPARWVECELQ